MSSCMHEHEQFSHSHPFSRLFCSIVSPLSHSHTFFSSFLDYVHLHLNLYCRFLLHSSHFLCLSNFVLFFCVFSRGGILVYNTFLFFRFLQSSCICQFFLLQQISLPSANFALAEKKLFNMLRFCHNLTNRLEQANCRVIPARLV